MTLLAGAIGARLLAPDMLPCAYPGTLVPLSSDQPSRDQAERTRAVQPFDDLAITRDVAYGPGARHRLDIYSPRAPGTGAPRPVVVFFYGGSWASGSKAGHAWVGATLARQGYVVVIPDYRIYPEARWPDFIEDNAAAVRWARDHAGAYGGDPASLVLMGHSAGAFDAASLAVDRRWLAAVGMEPQRDIMAVIGISGPYHLLPYSCRMKWIYGAKDQWADARPINHADGKSPPMLLLIGDRDDAANPRDSDQLAARIREHGGRAEVIHYPAFGHMDTLHAFLPPRGEPSPVLQAIDRFIAAVKWKPLRQGSRNIGTVGLGPTAAACADCRL